LQLSKRIQLNAFDKAFQGWTWLHAKWVEIVMGDERRSYMLCVPLAQQVGAKQIFVVGMQGAVYALTPYVTPCAL
jgi:hypothetical protein